MKKLLFRFIALLVLVFLCVVVYKYYLNAKIESINTVMKVKPSSSGETEVFLSFNATRFRDNNEWLGEPVTVLYESDILGDGDHYGIGPVEDDVKNRLSAYFGKERVILAIDSWKIYAINEIDPMAELHAQWYVNILQWAKEVLPGTDLGFYDFPNSAMFWDVDSESDNLVYHDALSLMISIIEKSDSLYPLFYVDNIEQIDDVMTNILLIAKTFKKPVLPFMWHRVLGKEAVGQVLPDSVIQKQCEFVTNYADGVVWWSKLSEPWNGGNWYPAAYTCFN